MLRTLGKTRWGLALLALCALAIPVTAMAGGKGKVHNYTLKGTAYNGYGSAPVTAKVKVKKNKLRKVKKFSFTHASSGACETSGTVKNPKIKRVKGTPYYHFGKKVGAKHFRVSAQIKQNGKVGYADIYILAHGDCDGDQFFVQDLHKR